MSSISRPLSDPWVWKQYVKNKDTDAALISSLDQDTTATGWRPCQSVPSDVHVELKYAGMIPDPLAGFNEHAIQCGRP
jgi:beta-mannosidase